jgi:hypothetical protein
MKKRLSRKWLEYDVFTTVMQVYRGEYAVDCAQSVKILRVSIPESEKILVKNSETVQIKQVLN